MSNKNRWTPAIPIKPKNSIVSSDAVANGIKSFIPTYEKECNVNMSHIMNNEYQRMWVKERTAFEKNTYQQGTTKPDPRNRKKYIPRAKPKKNVRELPIITLQRFQNIPSKTDHRR